MHFSELVKSCGVALLALISSARAHESACYTSQSNDLHCPKDWQPGFIHNTYTFIAPLQKFTNITGSFFNIVWYGDQPAGSTTGTDNVPGAIRGGFWRGGTYNETLSSYIACPDALEYTIHGKPWTYAAPGGMHLRLERYAETMRFESICGGKATHIDIVSYWCSDKPIVAYNDWNTAHMIVFPQLAASLGASILPGDCPRAYFTTKWTYIMESNGF
ncbi:hypothetical protein B0H11DRAFT_2189195 [Mycena galericulata]|nr:hypothetical protein B0H11DRAFT_2189195 [Mycena galericulata]